jgi:hypothetical protein
MGELRELRALREKLPRTLKIQNDAFLDEEKFAKK